MSKRSEKNMAFSSIKEGNTYQEGRGGEKKKPWLLMFPKKNGQRGEDEPIGSLLLV